MDVTGDQVDAYPDFVSKFTKTKKKPRTTVPVTKDDWYYNMNHRKRGFAVIFNHENFTLPELKQRCGTHADSANLKNGLENIGFDVKTYVDLTFKELDNIIDDISKYDFSESDCLLIAVLSHGENRAIYAKNMSYSTNVLFDRFTPDKCPTLAGKPKLFIIQACQGDKLDGGVDVDVDSGVSYKIPLQSDFLIAYSTMPGYYSWRNTSKGSWFIQALCEELDKYWQQHDLLSILTCVSRRVAYDFESNVPNNCTMHQQKQMPCVTTMLTRKIKFSPKNIESNGTQN